MGMRRPRYNMGSADWIGVEALGVPGSRTFRLLAYGRGDAAQLWLEKEQLQALAEAIARMLAEISGEAGVDLNALEPHSNPKPPGFPENPEIEIFVGALGLRYDSQNDLIAMEAFDRDAEDDAAPAFSCLATRWQLEALQSNSLEVITAGRPRCPLCGTPLSSPGIPHFCPPSNGHHRLTGDEE